MADILHEIDGELFATMNRFTRSPSDYDVVIVLSAAARMEFYLALRGERQAHYQRTEATEEYRGTKIAVWNDMTEQRVGVYVRVKPGVKQ